MSVLTPSETIRTCRSVFLRLEALIQFQKLFGWLVFGNVVNSNSSPTYISPVEVVNCQHCGSLVFIGQKDKSFRFPCNFIPCKSQIHNFPKFREYNSNITLIHGKVEVANEDIGTIILNRKTSTSECQDAFPVTLFLI